MSGLNGMSEDDWEHLALDHLAEIGRASCRERV